MLEDIALRYVDQSESNLRGIGYGLLILGAIIAGIVNKSKDELARAPYFAYSALIYLLCPLCRSFGCNRYPRSSVVIFGC